MRILELFSGTGSFSKVARARGHDVRTLDNETRFNPTYCMDIMDFEPSVLGDWRPDVIWASPPCQRFSVSSFSSSWRGIWHIRDKVYQPMDLRTGTAVSHILKTLDIIKVLAPRFWIIENPRANMRKMPFMPNEYRQTAWYCQYGDTRAKPTDLWTNIIITFRTCHNGADDHDPSPRGTRTGGTQGMKKGPGRAVVPEMLCSEVLDAIERGYGLIDMADEKELKDIEEGRMCKSMQREKKRLLNIASKEFQKHRDREERKANPKYKPKVLLTGLDIERKRMENQRDEYRRIKTRRSNQIWKAKVAVSEGKVRQLDQFNPDVVEGGEGVLISRARQQNTPDSRGVGPKGIP